ncbi:MAG: YqaJ viral recombinase family protein, partial [Halochromatium sp.]
MKIIDLAQRSPAWQQWRAQGITASEAAIILDRSPYKTRWR